MQLWTAISEPGAVDGRSCEGYSVNNDFIYSTLDYPPLSHSVIKEILDFCNSVALDSARSIIQDSPTEKKCLIPIVVD